jgi:acetyl esterase/lipase
VTTEPAPGNHERGTETPDLTVPYGSDDLQIADLFAARGAPRGCVIVLVHGGFWRNRWDRTHLYPMASALSREGYRVVLPEYRRVGDAGGGWPGTGEDLMSLLEAVSSPEWEGREADDPRRVVLVGHSAGGQLALWSQTRSASVQGVVALAGVVDLAAAHRDGLSDGAVEELLSSAPGASHGASFDQVLASADPMQLELPEAVALALVHGTLDDEVPVAYSRAYAARDGRIALDELPQAGHYELIDPASVAWPVVLRAIQNASRGRG